jgi:dinuclear metal center YbgI/SA1388 family protein
VNNFELEKYLEGFLKAGQIKDYCFNGLQVQGRSEISLIVTGVSASRKLIEAAADLKADAVIVHHGLFWRGDAPEIRGLLHGRVAPLIKSDINLYAYHLPLDAHPEIGNNVLLARTLGIRQTGWCDDGSEFPMVGLGELPDAVPAGEFMEKTDRILSHRSELVGDPKRPVRKVAWCTGSAGEFLPLAAECGADLFITGETPERNVHVADELGISLLAAGHHCTETLGIRALGEHIHNQFATQVRFIDLPNNF